MSSKHDPENSLHDIIENGQRVAHYLEGLSRETFETTKFARDAVERCIERACEAVVRLGDRAEALMPGQPLADIRGMGNRLRHAYDRIDVDIVWQTASIRLPELVNAAAVALARMDDSRASTDETVNAGKERSE